jgi:hypothetical protein
MISGHPYKTPNGEKAQFFPSGEQTRPACPSRRPRPAAGLDHPLPPRDCGHPHKSPNGEKGQFFPVGTTRACRSTPLAHCRLGNHPRPLCGICGQLTDHHPAKAQTPPPSSADVDHDEPSGRESRGPRTTARAAQRGPAEAGIKPPALRCPSGSHQPAGARRRRDQQASPSRTTFHAIYLLMLILLKKRTFPPSRHQPAEQPHFTHVTY